MKPELSDHSVYGQFMNLSLLSKIFWFPEGAGILSSQPGEPYLLSNVCSSFLRMAFHTFHCLPHSWARNPDTHGHLEQLLTSRPVVTLCMFLLDWMLDQMRVGFDTLPQPQFLSSHRGKSAMFVYFIMVTKREWATLMYCLIEI